MLFKAVYYWDLTNDSLWPFFLSWIWFKKKKLHRINLEKIVLLLQSYLSNIFFIVLKAVKEYLIYLYQSFKQVNLVLRYLIQFVLCLKFFTCLVKGAEFFSKTAGLLVFATSSVSLKMQ